MAAAAGDEELGRLLATAVLRPEPGLAAELAARMPAPSEPRPLSVTDLLNPRRAVFRRLRGPAPMPLEREARLEQGRAWHRRLGLALQDEGRLEVRVRRGGLTARIDLLTDLPVEVKSGSAPEDRPDQVEQLALYCALAGSPRGRLVHLVERSAEPPSLTASDHEFGDPAPVLVEAARREREIRDAIASQDPSSLGRCRWYDRGCEYRLAGLCSCRGDERPDPPVVAHEGTRTPRPEIAELWERRLHAAPPDHDPGVARYRDLLYPRRSYFDRREGRPSPGAPVRPPGSPLDAYERALAALESGPVGELHRLATRAEAPPEEVLGWRNAPCAVRSSRVRSRPTAEEIVARFPQYVLDLGLRCAATGTPRGTLVLGLEQAVPSGLQAFELTLTNGTDPFARWYEHRREALVRAIEQERPGELPACPAWMTIDCPYREVCACAAPPGRSQR